MNAEKKTLLKFFQKKPERYWKVKLFDELGFERMQCNKCKKYFWSISKQNICNDATCRPYEFIGKSPMKKRFDFLKMWDFIERFFKKKGHEILKPYPVICRWFPLYFTIAGIVDFYRMDNSNFIFELPSRNVFLMQPCLRFNDIPNTGVNARSYTCFFMIQQSSLFDGKKGYWKDECIEMDFELMIKLGINPEKINFIEDIWVGPNAFGSSLEYHIKGLELGNAVFTEFSGTLQNYKEMKEKVIDMGAGLERFTWLSLASLTSYDAVFPQMKKLLTNISFDKHVLKEYMKYSGLLNIDEVDVKKTKIDILKRIGVEELIDVIEKLEKMYAIVEHMRTLLFAISDGGLPSNTGGGYNLRIVLRRVFEFNKEFDLDLIKIAESHATYLKSKIPHLIENIDKLSEILDIENEQYKRTRKRASKLLKGYKKIDVDDLITLYESHGVTPDIVKEILNIEIPPKFYKKIQERHEKIKSSVKKIKLPKLPKTKILYYNDVYEFKANVLYTKNNMLVLDKTAFYPTSGGQMCDKGKINGIEVIDVKKQDNIILHYLRSPIKTKKVNCVVDKERRKRLSVHHTAAHIINLSCQRILGSHIWQAGALKTPEKAYLDITHYKYFLKDEIEKEANNIIREGIKIKKELLLRREAEKRYGMRIYQGGPVPSKVLRIISIAEDHEACGGIHVNNTKDVKKIKIISIDKIKDGIYRISFVAGDAIKEYEKKTEELINESKKILNIKNEEDLIKATKLLFKRWKKLKKKIEKLHLIKYRDNINIVNDIAIGKIDADINGVKDVAKGINARVKIIFGNKCFFIASDKNNALKIFNYMKKFNVKGGGNPKIVQGVINDVENAIKELKVMLWKKKKLF